MRVATIGACVRNRGRGGWAWCTEEGAQGVGTVARTTNNRLELRALSEALAAIDPRVRLEVITNSQYVVGVFTQWLSYWLDNGMRTASGKPVANEDLIMKIEAQLQDRRGRVTFKWRGHGGDPLHERAAGLATAAAVGRSGVAAGTALRKWRSDADGSPVPTGANGVRRSIADLTTEDVEALADRIAAVYSPTPGRHDGEG
jgi:ribonuclease HI